MTRFAEHQVVQRVDDDLVIVDESSGEEVLIRADAIPRLQQAIE